MRLRHGPPTQPALSIRDRSELLRTISAAAGPLIDTATSDADMATVMGAVDTVIDVAAYPSLGRLRESDPDLLALLVSHAATSRLARWHALHGYGVEWCRGDHTRADEHGQPLDWVLTTPPAIPGGTLCADCRTIQIAMDCGIAAGDADALDAGALAAIEAAGALMVAAGPIDAGTVATISVGGSGGTW